MSPTASRPTGLGLWPGPRSASLVAHVPSALKSAARLAADAAGYASLSEWMSALIADAIKLHRWHEELRADQTYDPGGRSLSDDPTEIDLGPPEQPLRERGWATLPPTEPGGTP